MRPLVSIAVGLILTIGAFAGFLLWGRVTNPPPFRIVVATRDIRPFEPLSTDVLVVDEQIISPRVAERYVQEHELGFFLDAVLIEPIYAGEPLTKSRLLLAENPASFRRLSLALGDPDYVALVIPVDPTTSVSDLYPGDRVNVEFGVGSAGDLGFGPEVGAPIPAETVEEGTVVLPLAKTLFQNLAVLQVNFEQIPNPNYGLGSLPDGSGTTEPPFLRGRIESIVVLIRGEDQELLTFALENGTVRIALASPLAATQPERVTPGVTWQDFIDRFMGERAAVVTEGASFQVTPVPEDSEITPGAGE